ncbi:MAG: DUF429 domain-containing protein [Nitrospirae bacterium]|nr:DUF429 domain-containing protein [Nitrospirota bacterium]
MIFIGADGCKAGWFTVLLTEGNEWKVNVFPDVSSLWDKYSSALVILLDVPIGLRERGPQERLCDIEARKLLGPRRASSVFPAPCRAAINAATYEEANNINKQMTEKGLSIQTWNIIPKIREVNKFLLNNESARLRIREIHPEICFWALYGRHPMKHSKKTKEGFSERMQVLQSVYSHTDNIISHALSTYRRNEVARDDILDALSATVTASGGLNNIFSIPEAPELDSKGLRMEIVYRASISF